MLSKAIQILTVSVLLVCQLLAEVTASQSNSQSFKCPAYLVPCKSDQSESSQKSTILTFHIQQKAEQQQNYIELSLTIKQKDNSLKKAIDKANKKVELVKSVSEEYCKKNGGDKCEQTVQVDNFNVEPSYQIVRRQPIFNGFVVAHEVKIVVHQTQNVGELVDSLLGLGIYQIQELEWKPFVEIDLVEKAIDAGITQAKLLCSHINRKIGAILSITEIYEDNQQQAGDEEGETGAANDEQEEEEEPSVLKFQIQCINKTPEDEQNEKRQAEGEKAGKKKKKKKQQK